MKVGDELTREAMELVFPFARYRVTWAHPRCGRVVIEERVRPMFAPLPPWEWTETETVPVGPRVPLESFWVFTEVERPD